MPSGCASPRAQRPAGADRPAWLSHPPTLTIQQRSPRRGWRGPAPDRVRRAHRRGVRWARHAAPAWPCPPAWWVGRSLAQAKGGGDAWWAAGRRAGPGSSASSPDRGSTRPIDAPAGRCTCWPKPDDPRRCTPQTCDWRCRVCSIHGRPFYSHVDLQYLEHGSGPLVAELDRLRWVRGRANAAVRGQECGHALTPAGAAAGSSLAGATR
jgi:hypothetical protein